MREKGTVVILATGGTIAGVGGHGRATGYTSGALTAETLIRGLPELQDVAPVESMQVCNVNSDDITGEIWLELARTINETANDENVAGFVITHGTDTLEETAFFLHLAVRTEKPVVITGSMRPSTSLSADGPMNLYQAVCVAASPASVGRGVLAVFSDRIYAARSVTKTSTYHLTAISSGEMGALGIIRDGEVFWYEEKEKPRTPPCDMDGLTRLPQVSILFFAVDADPALLIYAAMRAEGLVIAGAGAGEFSGAYRQIIEKLEIPVVISSRINDGLITQDIVLCKNTIAANHLSPQKAAVLLRVALAQRADREQIKAMFARY